MDINQDGEIEVEEFIEVSFKAFNNGEDTIEFLAKDIKAMDEKIAEVTNKLGMLKERESGFLIEGVPIMKGSTLNLNIIDGQFDSDFFDPKQFSPMIQIVVNDDE